jgi:hypothetical protein
MARAWLLVPFLGLAGCTTTGTPAEPPPANYRALVVAEARQKFFDPYSIRDATISEPIPGMGNLSTVCVRANAKNRLGGYTGQNVTAFVFSGGRIVMSDQELTILPCISATYGPFPELEAAAQATR